MAKELPYFRFTVSEWLNGDITLESYELQGLFINICSYYWFKDCILNLDTLNKRFSNARILLEQICSNGFIKINKDNFIEINFLDEQRQMLLENSKKRSEAGKIGGFKKSSNAKILLKQKSSYKDKDKDKDNNRDFNKFYQSEIKENNLNDNDNYSIFVKFLFENNDTKEPLINVLKIKKQIKYTSFQKLLEKAKSNNVKLVDLIYQLNNKKEYYSKVEDLYLTLNNWINNNSKNK